MTTALVIDASCDIPHSLIKQHNITVLPVSVFTNGEETRDWRTPETTLHYYQHHLIDKNNQVSTQPVNVDDAVELLSEQVLPNADYVVVQTTSRTRSETFDRLTEAAHRLNLTFKNDPVPKQVRVMDSHCLFAGQGIIAAHTQALINKGLEGSQLRRAATAVADFTHTLVVPPDLYYIRERARQRGEDSINFVRAMMGKALGITPVVCGFREKNFPTAKFKGFASAVEGTLEHVLRQIDRKTLKSPYIGLSYAGDLQDLNAYDGMHQLRARHEAGDIRLLISTMGLAGATYLGPGALSVGLSCEENEWSHPE